MRPSGADTKPAGARPALPLAVMAKVLCDSLLLHQKTSRLSPLQNSNMTHSSTQSCCSDGATPRSSFTRGCSPEHMSGWVGKFVSYGAGGTGEGDVRFQDTWLRLFQEHDPRGKFVMKMIRKADQANKSWPRGVCALAAMRPAQTGCIPAVARM